MSRAASRPRTAPLAPRRIFRFRDMTWLPGNRFGDASAGYSVFDGKGGVGHVEQPVPRSARGTEWRFCWPWLPALGS